MRQRAGVATLSRREAIDALWIAMRIMLRMHLAQPAIEAERALVKLVIGMSADEARAHADRILPQGWQHLVVLGRRRGREAVRALALVAAVLRSLEHHSVATIPIR